MDSDQAHIEEELAKIEELHQRDMQASRDGDYDTLRTLLTPDAVMMPPNQPAIRGQEELEKSYRRMQEAMGEVDILEYRLEFEEVRVLGDYAYEWGTIRGKSRTWGDEAAEASFKVMRILKKGPGGEWRVHRSIWNADPGE